MEVRDLTLDALGKKVWLSSGESTLVGTLVYIEAKGHYRREDGFKKFHPTYTLSIDKCGVSARSDDEIEVYA